MGTVVHVTLSGHTALSGQLIHMPVHAAHATCRERVKERCVNNDTSSVQAYMRLPVQNSTCLVCAAADYKLIRLTTLACIAGTQAGSDGQEHIIPARSLSCDRPVLQPSLCARLWLCSTQPAPAQRLSCLCGLPWKQLRPPTTANSLCWTVARVANTSEQHSPLAR